MNALLILPLLIPLATAALCVTCWSRVRLQRWLALLGSAALLVAAGVLLLLVWQNGIHITQVGNWKAPFGIVLVADVLSAVMVLLAALMNFAVVLFSIGSTDRRREVFGHYPLLNILMMGVCGAFLTGDAFNLFVWFEVMLIASFVLLALGSERAQLEGAIKYVTINLIASAIFLTTLGLLYGMAGTLNMADLAVKLADTDQPGLVTTMAMMFLIAFGIKAAIFPLFMWLPASYHTPPAVVSAIFAGLMTKVGVYALIRVFTLIFVQDIGYTHSIILIIACLTMITGALGAIVQNDFRRALSFNIISQIGIVLAGLGLMMPLAMSGMIFLIIEDVVVLTALFLVTGLVCCRCGTFQLPRLGGLYASSPGLGVLFLIPALSLAGIPPLPGFFAKLALLRSMLSDEQYVVAAIMLATSLLTLFSMTRLWSEVFWKERKVEPALSEGPAGKAFSVREKWLMVVPVAVLGVLTIGMGLAAEPVFQVASRAAEQLLNPAEYVEAVLGTAGVTP